MYLINPPIGLGVASKLFVDKNNQTYLPKATKNPNIVKTIIQTCKHMIQAQEKVEGEDWRHFHS